MAAKKMSGALAGEPTVRLPDGGWLPEGGSRRVPGGWTGWAISGLMLVFGCRSAPSDRAPHLSAVSEPDAPPLGPSYAAGTGGSATEDVKSEEHEPPLDAPPGLDPLVGPAARTLAVAGFQAAVVAVPVGAVQPRPLVIALHGNYDRPEWQCEVWQAALKGYPFVLCPRGSARRDAPRGENRWTYDGGRVFKEEIEAALGALALEFGGRVAPGAGIFVGFSLGAIFGVPALSGLAARFPYAVLIEGGLGALTKPMISSYRDAGGKRLLLACGQAACRQTAKTRAALATKLRVPTEVADGGNIGHTYDGPVAAAVSLALPWLVAGDPSWAGALASPAQAEQH